MATELRRDAVLCNLDQLGTIELSNVLPHLKGTYGFVAQIGRRACYPFPQTDLAYWLSDGYAKSSVAVEDGDTDLDLCDLPIKVPRDQRLAE